MLLAILALLTLAAQGAPELCTDPLSCLDGCDAGDGAACAVAGALPQAQLVEAHRARLRRKGCTLGTVNACLAYAKYAEDELGTQAALDVVGPHCIRGVQDACSVIGDVLLNADDAARTR